MMWRKSNMVIDAIGVTPSSDATGLNKNSIVNQTEFLKIMLAQLRFQDPLKPMDNQQFVAQLAQFSALEINREQSDKVNTLLAVESNSQSIGLLGRNVEFYTDTGTAVGTVTAITIADGSPSLTVVGSDNKPFVNISPARVRLIRPSQGN